MPPRRPGGMLGTPEPVPGPLLPPQAFFSWPGPSPPDPGRSWGPGRGWGTCALGVRPGSVAASLLCTGGPPEDASQPLALPPPRPASDSRGPGIQARKSVKKTSSSGVCFAGNPAVIVVLITTCREIGFYQQMHLALQTAASYFPKRDCVKGRTSPRGRPGG